MLWTIILLCVDNIVTLMPKQLEDSIWFNRRRKSKQDRQNNDHNKKDRKANNDPLNTTQKTKD